MYLKHSIFAAAYKT